MTSSVKESGSIVIQVSPRQAEIITSSLASKNIQLMQDPFNRAICKEIRLLYDSLNEKLPGSNKNADCSLMEATEVVMLKPEIPPRPIGFRKKIVDFFYPPFSTSDFESARTRCGYGHIITDMEDFDKREYPSKVYGKVLVNRLAVVVGWDSRGKCYSNGIFNHSKYDLIHPNKKK